jgi:hypothetical protein
MKDNPIAVHKKTLSSIHIAPSAVVACNARIIDFDIYTAVVDKIDIA